MSASVHRSAKERNLYVVALLFSIFGWLAVVVSIVGLIYAPFIALFVVIGRSLWLASITGNSIRVGTRQLPDLYRRVQEAARKLDLAHMPEVYVTSGGGILNAFATKLFSRNFVILNSEILDACEALDKDKDPGAPSAVDFILGHEIGHLALGHLSTGWLLWPAKLVPLVGPAYSRACEYSCDACGLAVCGDVETASRTLAVLAAGGKQAKKVSLEALLEQRHDTGGLAMSLVELNSTHPYLSKRVAAVHRLKDGGIAPDVGRNPLSYVMAPFFGMVLGGAASYVMVYVAVIGMLAAIAIPNFLKYQERAKTASLANPSSNTDPFAALAALDAGLAGDAQEAPAAVDAFVPPVAAPAVDPVAAPPVRAEARTWLKQQLAAKNKKALTGASTTQAAVLAEKLYAAGAKKVFVSGVAEDDEGVFAEEIVAELPEKAGARKKLVDLCTAEYKKQGYTDPCLDEGQPELFFSW